MYLVTAKHVRDGGDEGQEYQECGDMNEARLLAEQWAAGGYYDVRVWMMTASVKIEPKAVWSEHARGLGAVS